MAWPNPSCCVAEILSNRLFPGVIAKDLNLCCHQQSILQGDTAPETPALSASTMNTAARDKDMCNELQTEAKELSFHALQIGRNTRKSVFGTSTPSVINGAPAIGVPPSHDVGRRATQLALL